MKPKKIVKEQLQFFAHFMSESCDHRYIQFRASAMPESDADWYPIMEKEGLLDREGEPDDVELPGTCNSWWSLRHVERVMS